MRLTKLFAIPSCFLAAVFCGNTLVLAEEEEAEKITVVGTRSHERSAADLAVPVDTLDADTLLRQGASRMEDMLSRIAPSFSVSPEPLSDAGTLVRPANMRGLPPDSTLILVNGKRRHRSSVITFLTNGLNAGSHGADLSAIPAIALDRVEILRDNAGAQYGSDAVAGIINFVLKEDSEGGSLDVRWGQYYEGDGENITVSSNIGLPLTENGFLNLSAEYNEADPTFRSTQSGRSDYLIAAGNQHVRRNPPPMVWGSPDIEDNYKLFANAAIGLGDLHEVYAFGNYAERTVDGGFYFRSPRRRSGIFAGDRDEDIAIRDEQQPSIVIDQMPWAGSDYLDTNCALNVPDSARGSGNELDAIDADPRCYAFNLKFPGGFTPQFGGDIEDTSFAFGIRGELMEDFTYDISGVYGRHEVDHFIYNTINPQLAAQENAIPTSYNPGGYVETDYTFNLDFTTQFDIDAFYSPLHVGFGVEYREEEFETKRGELNSWFIDYYTTDLNGDGNATDSGEFEEPANLASMTCAEYQEYSARVGDDGDLKPKYPSLGAGSNGFTGFSPCSEGKDDRSSIGAYIDFEADVTENVLLGLAVRHEDPEEFDSTLDGKFSARLQATDTLALRGSVGTGFRVPTVGQANVQNVTTTISEGQLVDELTLPPSHALLRGIAEPLDAEESTSLGLGAVINVGGFDLTIDYYHIEVDDRVAITSPESLDCLLMRKAGHSGACVDISKASSAIPEESRTASGRVFSHVLRGKAQDDSEDEPMLTAAERARFDDAVMERDALRSAVPNIDAIGQAKYFANDFDTTTEGIDIVATYPMDLFDGLTTLTFAANWNRTKIDKRNSGTINDRRKHIIEEGRPKVRWTFTADHESGPWQILGRVRYYGSHVDYAGGGYDDDITLAEARTLVDLEATYNFTDNLAFSLGAENLLDNEPTRHAHPGSYGNLYPESTPFDYNGGFYYAKAMLNF